MDLFHVLSCLCLGSIAVQGGPPEYDVSKLCEEHDVTVFTSAVLKADQMWLRAGETCSVRVLSSFHAKSYTDKLRLGLLTLDTSCGDGYLQLFDGDERHGDTLSGKICGDIGFQQTAFLSSKTDNITVTIHSIRDHTLSLRLLATATSKDYRSNDFICDNLWDVARSVVCDGYDNCGDWSDEKSYLCPDDLMPWRWSAILLSACAWMAFIALVVVVSCLIRVKLRRRRLQLQGNGAASPITTGQVQTTPIYGSTTPTTFVPTPPPYSPPLTPAPTRLPPPPYSPFPPPSKSAAASVASGSAEPTTAATTSGTTSTTNATGSATDC